MFFRKKLKEVIRKAAPPPELNNLGKAVMLAKKMHEEYSSKEWFRATKLTKVADNFAVLVLVEPEYAYDAEVLIPEKFIEDGVQVTFSHQD
jgi:hypothetical protein